MPSYFDKDGGRGLRLSNVMDLWSKKSTKLVNDQACNSLQTCRVTSGLATS
jgi:hypothetical protein